MELVRKDIGRVLGELRLDLLEAREENPECPEEMGVEMELQPTGPEIVVKRYDDTDIYATVRQVSKQSEYVQVAIKEKREPYTNKDGHTFKTPGREADWMETRDNEKAIDYIISWLK